MSAVTGRPCAARRAWSRRRSAPLTWASRRTSSRWPRRCATRCSPAGSACGRCSAWRPPRRFGLPAADALPAALALELVHTFSLVHDDLPALDDDDLRRGRPTAHVQYGEAVAILTGDALLNAAFTLLAERQGGPPERRIAAIAELARAVGPAGMIGGQYLDVTAADGIDEAGLRRLCQLKTGALIEASVGWPLALAVPPAGARPGLRGYAAEVGLLFQIVDDVLDATGTDAVLGKRAGADERAGKRTHVTVLGLAARALARTRTAGVAALGARRHRSAARDRRPGRPPRSLSDAPSGWRSRRGRGHLGGRAAPGCPAAAAGAGRRRALVSLVASATSGCGRSARPDAACRSPRPTCAPTRAAPPAARSSSSPPWCEPARGRAGAARGAVPLRPADRPAWPGDRDPGGLDVRVAAGPPARCDPALTALVCAEREAWIAWGPLTLVLGSSGRRQPSRRPR